MALLATSKLFWRGIVLVGNMADADGGYSADMGNCSWAGSNDSSIFLYKYSNDGKIYFDLKVQL